MANKHFQFLRSTTEYTSFDAAKAALSDNTLLHGEPALAYYTEDGKKKALLAIGGKESGQIYFYNSDKIEELIAAAEARVNATIEALTAANVAYASGSSDTYISASNTVEQALRALDEALVESTEAQKSYKIVSAPVDDANVKEAYKIQVSNNGSDYRDVGGSSIIKIYKDSALIEVYLGTSADTINSQTGEITKVTTKDAQSLNFKYQLADGTYSLTKIDVTKFLTQSEFKNGLQVSDTGEVSVKIDVTSDDFLTVGADGLKLSGVTSAIDTALASGKAYTDNKIAALDTTVSGKSTYSTVKIDEVDGILTAVEITDTIGNVSTDTAGYAEATEVKTYVDTKVANKNVGAAGETGDTALITAEANYNTVTVTSTKKLKDAVNRAESAVLSVGKSSSVESYVSLSVTDGDNVTISINDAQLSTKIAALEGDENSTSGDTSIHGAKKYAEAIVANKNVGAAGETGDTALITAEANYNTVTVTSTKKLKDAVTAAETALQKVNGTKNQITVTTKASGEQTISFAEDAIWDCGTWGDAQA